MVLRSLASSLVIALLATACGAASSQTCTGTDLRLHQEGTLTVATDYSYPPFAFRSNKGDLVGFDVDVTKALAKEMKLDIKFLNRGVGALVPGALAHRHDLAVSGLRETDRLREQGCLSVSYLDADLAILVGSLERAGIADASDLGGRTVGVLEGSRAEEWADENLDGSRLASLPTTDDLLSAIRGEQVDAVVDELAIARFAAKESSAFNVAARIETSESFVFVSAPDNAVLIDRVNDAVTKLRANGKRAKIERKWFGG